MQIYSAEDVRKMDAMAQTIGIDGILLMEHAAMGLYACIQNEYPQATRIVIACGSGNNGGDGFALARLLAQHSEYELCIICDVQRKDMSKDEAYFAKFVAHLEIPWIQTHDETLIKHQLTHADVIVDALFGTGLNREIEGWYAWLIDCINKSHASVIAADIPSGLLADSGDIAGCCVQAEETITFAQGKLGLYIKQGMKQCGHVRIQDISIPRQISVSIQPLFTILEKSLLTQLLPKRFADSHKGSYGKGLLIGGSENMSGAVALAGQAALRCGIGTLTMMVPRSVGHMIAGNIPEAMRLMMEEEHGEFLPCEIRDRLSYYDAIAIGNGMGRGKGAEDFVIQVLQSDVPCILDGDAIYLASKHKHLLKRNAVTILTPHPKEVSYLTGISIKVIKKNPLEALKMLESVCLGATIIMKDTKTMISSENERYLNIIGNDGLAKGGSGDVLCGMVLGWLAQTKKPTAAACLGVYLHATCAQLLQTSQTTYSMLPHDLLKVLPKAIQSIAE